jgi:hypothetical protein
VVQLEGMLLKTWKDLQTWGLDFDVELEVLEDLEAPAPPRGLQVPLEEPVG